MGPVRYRGDRETDSFSQFTGRQRLRDIQKGTRHDKRGNIQQTEEFITHKHKKKKGETRETLAKDISSETREWDRRTLLVVSPSRTWTS